jgi:outer membrane protein TolC
MHKTRLILLGALTAFITACTLGPNFERPATPDQPAYSQSLPPAGSASSVTYGGDVAADWYELFHSEGLNALVRQALENSPDLDAARHGLLAAQFELKAVAGSALPQIDASGEVGRAHVNGSFLYGPVNTLDVTGNRFALGPSLAYNLDLFGGVHRSIESQQAATSGIHEQVLDTYVTLIDQVVINAFDYAATRAQIKVTQALVQELRAQFDLTQRLEQAGKITRSDTLTAQTQLDNVVATLPGLEQQRDVYRNALAQLSGVAPDDFKMPELSLEDFIAALGARAPPAGYSRCRGHPASGERTHRDRRRGPLSVDQPFCSVRPTNDGHQRIPHPAGRPLVGRCRPDGSDISRRYTHGARAGIEGAVPAGAGDIPQDGRCRLRRSCKRASVTRTR